MEGERSNMGEGFKRFLTTILVLLILAGIGYAGYTLIGKETKKRLASLEQQTKTVGEEKTPTASPENIILPNQPKAEKKSSFSLKAPKTAFKVGESFNLEVLVNAQGEKVDGAEFLLAYDSKTIEISNLNPGTFFSLYPQKTIDSQNGTVRVIALEKPSEDKVLNEEVVATLTVKTLVKGKATFNFETDKTHIAGYGGQELLQKADSLTITIE